MGAGSGDHVRLPPRPYVTQQLTEFSSRHGRDNRLLVWQLGLDDEANMDHKLPMDAVATTQKLPWLLYAMPVNALNFCPFAMCYDGMPQISSSVRVVKDATALSPILFAVPNAIDSGGVSLSSGNHSNPLTLCRLTYSNCPRVGESLQSTQIDM